MLGVGRRTLLHWNRPHLSDLFAVAVVGGGGVADKLVDILDGKTNDVAVGRGMHSSVFAQPAEDEGSMDYKHYTEASLAPDALELHRVAREFARNELQPRGGKWDAESHFPVDTLRSAARLGFAALNVSEESGGSGLCRAESAAVFEALAMGDIPFTTYLTIHNMVASTIERFGTLETRSAYIPRLASMDMMASYCLTEPESGSDAASLSTSATPNADGSYTLSGTKCFISGGGSSDLYLVMARTGGAGHGGISAFLVEKGWEGLSFGSPENKMGWRSQPTTTVHLDGVRVPAENRLAEEGEGFKIAMTALDGGRINIAAASVGGAQFCLDYAREYAAGRTQFGKPIADYQATHFKLADMATDVMAARLMVQHAAMCYDRKELSTTLAAAMAKRFATDACFDVANQSLQILGGYGYLKDYPVERFVRDLRVHSILEGTNEIMRVIINRQLADQG